MATLLYQDRVCDKQNKTIQGTKIGIGKLWSMVGILAKYPNRARAWLKIPNAARSPKMLARSSSMLKHCMQLERVPNTSKARAWRKSSQ